MAADVGNGMSCRSAAAAGAILLTGVVLWGLAAPTTRPAGTSPSIDPDVLGANTGCYVCHMTFIKEELAKSHLAKNVGCIKCHGPSIKHANDEDVGATKPDITYPRGQVNESCRKCHVTHDVAPEKVAARVIERGVSKQPVCTDCHGAHRIARALPTTMP